MNNTEHLAHCRKMKAIREAKERLRLSEAGTLRRWIK